MSTQNENKPAAPAKDLDGGRCAAADGERLVKNEPLDIRALLSEAKCFVEIFVAANPRWDNHYNGTQDPRGAHDLLKRITTALSSPNQ